MSKSKAKPMVTAPQQTADAMSSPAHAPVASPSFLRRAVGALGSIGAAGVIVAVMAGGIFALQMRAAAEAPVTANPPVTVATTRIDRQNAYTVEARYVGRIEAARETEVAFERGGLVMEVAFEEGESVDKGAVIAKLDTQQLEAQGLELTAQKRELQAQIELAEATLDRQKNLSSKGWSPEQRYDEARFEVSRLQASMDRVDAQLKLNQIDIAKSTLIAPFAGTVGARMIDEGAVVAAGSPVLNVIESTVVHARIGLPTNVAAELALGSTGTLQSGAVTTRGKLLRKREDLAASTRTVTAIYGIDDMQGVPLGEVVTLNLERDIEAPGAWLPIASLNEGRKGLWSVFLVRADTAGPDARIEREAVEVLHTADNRVYAQGAFRDGDRIVTNGTNRIIPGQRVALAD